MVTAGGVSDTVEEQSPGTVPTKAKVGRRPRIDRMMIARAAKEVGLDKLTMKAVADFLGVSVAGLYHHVEGRDDLIRLGAEYSAAQIPVPVDHGQHWTSWLLEWAHYVHGAFVTQPALLGQFLNGSIAVDRMASDMDTVFGVLSRHGFSPIEALEAYGLVNDCAIGAAVAEIRQRESRGERRQPFSEFNGILANEPSDALPHFRRVASSARSMKNPFNDRVRTLLIGIAVQRGDQWTAILDLTYTPAKLSPLDVMLHP
jgi:AcrR family transcriptional regulator